MIKQKLQDEQIRAMKAGEKDKVTTIRYILAQIQNKAIEKKDELTDEETVAVLKKIAKELKESIESFEKGGRTDLVEEYKKQLDLVSQYLPEEISDEELKKEVERIINQNKAIYDKNPKAVIGIAIRELKSKADPSRIIKVLESFKTYEAG
jgi:hypothetical protein